MVYRYEKYASDYIKKAKEHLKNRQRVEVEFMGSLNKVILIGNLGKDPELKYTGGGTPVCTFSIATTEKWGDESGQREKTEWHKIIVWGKAGENASKYLSKGKSVFVQGRIQTRQWEDSAGQKRYSTEIVADNVQYLSPRDQNNSTTPSVSDIPDFGGF
jgi:single-strand DNA-binding protein